MRGVWSAAGTKGSGLLLGSFAGTEQPHDDDNEQNKGQHRQKEQANRDRKNPAKQSHSGFAAVLALWGYSVSHISSYHGRSKESVDYAEVFTVSRIEGRDIQDWAWVT